MTDKAEKDPNRLGPRPPGTARRYQTNRHRPFILLGDAGAVHIEVFPREETEGVELKNGVVIEPEDPDFNAVNLVLTGSKATNRVFLNLTSMTELELLALRDAFDLAIRAALPIARALDEKARDEAPTTHRPNRRLYRGIPILYGGNGAATAYLPGVRDESSDPLEVVWPAGHQPRRTRAADDEVADGDGGDEERLDDPPAPVERDELREVGPGGGEGLHGLLPGAEEEAG